MGSILGRIVYDATVRFGEVFVIGPGNPPRIPVPR